jgi:hypothetical protein
MTGLMYNELERAWKEAVVAYFNVLSRQFPGETEENYENLSQNRRSPGRDLKLRLTEYEALVIITRP